MREVTPSGLNAPGATRVALVCFDGFQELDAFIPLALLNQMRPRGWSAELCGPGPVLSSMNGLQQPLQRPLEWANEAEAVLFVGGLYNRAVAENSALLDRLQLDPLRQRLGALGSGSLLLARLGLLGESPACCDAATRPWLLEAGVRVLEHEAFHAQGPVATCSGGLAAPLLAAWLIREAEGEAAVREALRPSLPAGDREVQLEQILAQLRRGSTSLRSGL